MVSASCDLLLKLHYCLTVSLYSIAAEKRHFQDGFHPSMPGISLGTSVIEAGSDFSVSDIAISCIDSLNHCGLQQKDFCKALHPPVTPCQPEDTHREFNKNKPTLLITPGSPVPEMVI